MLNRDSWGLLFGLLFFFVVTVASVSPKVRLCVAFLPVVYCGVGHSIIVIGAYCNASDAVCPATIVIVLSGCGLYAQLRRRIFKDKRAAFQGIPLCFAFGDCQVAKGFNRFFVVSVIRVVPSYDRDSMRVFFALFCLYAVSYVG